MLRRLRIIGYRRHCGKVAATGCNVPTPPAAIIRRIVVCREPRARRTEDGIEILPASVFVQRLWAGELG